MKIMTKLIEVQYLKSDYILTLLYMGADNDKPNCCVSVTHYFNHTVSFCSVKT